MSMRNQILGLPDATKFWLHYLPTPTNIKGTVMDLSKALELQSNE